MIHILTNTYQLIDPWFGRSSTLPIELDLGCGKGRFALALAKRYPERLILAGDVMLGRLRKVARKAEQQQLENIELMRASNIDLAAFQLPDSCIRRAHFLCPDPWPKEKHRNKRLFTTDFLTRLTRILEPGGILHVATDHEPYLQEIQGIVATLNLLKPAPAALEDIQDLKTDFELIWENKGKTVPHLAYICKKRL